MRDHHAVNWDEIEGVGLDRLQAGLLAAITDKTRKAVFGAAQKKGVSIPQDCIQRIAWFRLQGFNKRGDRALRNPFAADKSDLSCAQRG